MWPVVNGIEKYLGPNGMCLGNHRLNRVYSTSCITGAAQRNQLCPFVQQSAVGFSIKRAIIAMEIEKMDFRSAILRG
jgi:hypothetical protein